MDTHMHFVSKYLGIKLKLVKSTLFSLVNSVGE